MTEDAIQALCEERKANFIRLAKKKNLDKTVFTHNRIKSLMRLAGYVPDAEPEATLLCNTVLFKAGKGWRIDLPVEPAPATSSEVTKPSVEPSKKHSGAWYRKQKREREGKVKTEQVPEPTQIPKIEQLETTTTKEIYRTISTIIERMDIPEGGTLKTYLETEQTLRTMLEVKLTISVDLSGVI